MNKTLIIALVVIGALIATGTNVLSGGMADLLILGTLIVVLGPLRVLELIGIFIAKIMSVVFLIIAIAGG